MQFNKIALLCFTLLVIPGLLFTACKKESGYTITTTTDDSASQTIIASDELNINYEFNQALIDAMIASSITPTTGGRTTGNVLFTTIPHATIDTTQINAGLIAIHYDGANADNTKGRSGEVDIIYAVDSGKVIPWSTKGATAKIIFTAFEITLLANPAKTLWMNGIGTMTNITGGMLTHIADTLLVPGDSLADKVSAQLAYTHDDNGQILKTWAWNCNMLRVFNLHDTTITMSIKGDTTMNGINNVADWGVTTANQNFYAGITTSVTQNISSSFFLHNPLSGIKVIGGIAEPVTAIYGVNRQGSPAGNDSPYGYKITWTNSAGQSQQAVISY